MTSLSADRVQETSTTIGIGAIALAGATLPSMNTFASAFANGALVGYVVLNQAVQTEWEKGVGTYNANSIARTYVTGGSNGTSPVDFSAGIKLVMSVAPQTQQAQAYSATQVYAPGDTVTVSGVLWYALAVNLGSAPSPSNTSWSQMSGQGAGVYLPLTGGTLTGAVSVPSFYVNGAASAYPGIAWQDAGVSRWSWSLFPDDTLQLVRYNASGVNQGSALVFNTSNGGLTCSGGLSGTNVWANATLYRSPANDPTTPIAQPQTFVQSTDPGAAAADNDLWIWTNTKRRASGAWVTVT